MNDAIVSITDAHSDATRVDISEVRAGFQVFDTFGGRHAVKSVRSLKHEVRIIRTDGIWSYHEHGSDITVIKPA